MIKLFFQILTLIKDLHGVSNWKTTIIGLIGAIATAVYPLLTTGTISKKDILSAVVVAALGWFAKDSNVSGGTVLQPKSTIQDGVTIPEAKELKESPIDPPIE